MYNFGKYKTTFEIILGGNTMNGLIVVLSGPSGAGKGTVYNEIAKKRNNVRKEISVTTREKRNGEVDGKDYLFVSKETFLKWKKQEKFIESVEYDGQYYGTLKVNLNDLKDFDIFFDKDVRGALKIKECYPEAILIYIMPKDVDTLIKRRGDRGKNRHELSKGEVEIAKHMEWLVINDDIDIAVLTIEGILNCVRNNRMSNKENIQFLSDFY